MNVERGDSDLLLQISENELTADPGVLDRAQSMALEMPGVMSLVVLIDFAELASHAELFSDRYIGAGLKGDKIVRLRLQIRRKIPAPDTSERIAATSPRTSRPRLKKIAARASAQEKGKGTPGEPALVRC